MHIHAYFKIIMENVHILRQNKIKNTQLIMIIEYIFEKILKYLLEEKFCISSLILRSQRNVTFK